MYFNTDKIEPHQYFQAYVQLAGRLGPYSRVCEIGVLDGESLRMWQALFPCGEITGVDISPDSTWPEGTVRVVANQADPALPGMLGGQFDLIVEDGCHVGEMSRRTFDILWPIVKPGGYYVIEDWMVSLRPSSRPGETWGKSWGNGMLRMAQSFLPLLDFPDAACESIEYRYGLIIIHRSAND